MNAGQLQNLRGLRKYYTSASDMISEMIKMMIDFNLDDDDKKMVKIDLN